jgi:hypothetical protein
MSTSAVIVLALIVVAVIWAIGIYNGLISMRQRVNQAFADIDVQLRQRHDVPTPMLSRRANLVSLILPPPMCRDLAQRTKLELLATILLPNSAALFET